MALERKTTQEHIYLALRQELISGRFRFGDKIQEKELADDFQVSRTPMREAVARLEQEGLLVSRPYSGYFVREYSYDEIKGLVEIRILLESAAAQSFAERVTDEEGQTLQAKLERCEIAIDSGDVRAMVQANNDLHTYIAEASGNPWIPQLLQTVQAHFGIVRLNSLNDANRRSNIKQEHRNICNAIVTRDPAAAAQAMGVHLGNARTFVLSQAQSKEAARP